MRIAAAVLVGIGLFVAAAGCRGAAERQAPPAEQDASGGPMSDLDNELYGAYLLRFELDGPARRHYLHLAPGEHPGEVRVRATIDRGPGHEARRPGPDENVHLVAAVGRLEGHTLHASLVTGVVQREVFDLELSLCPQRTAVCVDPAARLQGSVQRTRGERKRSESATAEPADAAITRAWPSFETLVGGRASPRVPFERRVLARAPPGYQGPSRSSSGVDEELLRGAPFRPQLPPSPPGSGAAEPPAQAPADPEALGTQMDRYKAAADAIIDELRAAATARGADREALFGRGVRRIYDAMPAVFGPANAELFQERHRKVVRLGDALGVRSERQQALVEAFEAAAAAEQTGPEIGRDRALQLAEEFVRTQPAPSESEQYDLESAHLLTGAPPDDDAYFVGFERTPVRARALGPDVVRVDQKTGRVAWFSHPEGADP